VRRRHTALNIEKLNDRLTMESFLYNSTYYIGLHGLTHGSARSTTCQLSQPQPGNTVTQFGGAGSPQFRLSASKQNINHAGRPFGSWRAPPPVGCASRLCHKSKFISHRFLVVGTARQSAGRHRHAPVAVDRHCRLDQAGPGLAIARPTDRSRRAFTPDRRGQFHQ